jgi:hypothetical protein
MDKKPLKMGTVLHMDWDGIYTKDIHGMFYILFICMNVIVTNVVSAVHLLCFCDL